MYSIYILPVLIHFPMALSGEECELKNDKLCKLSKCCPLGLVYNLTERLCVESVVKNSLEDKNCGVVKVHYIPKDKVTKVVVIKGLDLIYKNQTYAFGRYCIDETMHQNNYVLKLCHSREYCTESERFNNNAFCLKKCCPHGQGFRKNNLGKVSCVNSNGNDINITSYSSDIIRGDVANIALFHEGVDCPKYIANYSRHKFYIVQNGSIFIEERGNLRESSIKQQKYCLENYQRRNEVFVCANSNKNQTKFKYSRPIMVFSCVCLFVAMLRFMFCIKTMKLMQKMLVFFCFSELVSFGVISFLQFGFLTPNKPGCQLIGFIHLFAALAAFFWLNVISFSLWKTIGSMTSKTSTEKCIYKTFLLYSCYVWCVAGVITTICYLDNSHNILPSKFHPYLGKTRCILEHSFKDANYGYIIYFIVPTSGILMANTIFFGLTIGYVVNVKVAIARMGSVRNRIEKQSLVIFNDTFKMALKLFVVMGCTWLFEIISTLYDFRQSYTLERIEVVLDTINSLQGFLLLLIFDYKGLVQLFSFCKFKSKGSISITN